MKSGMVILQYLVHVLNFTRLLNSNWVGGYKLFSLILVAKVLDMAFGHFC